MSWWMCLGQTNSCSSENDVQGCGAALYMLVPSFTSFFFLSSDAYFNVSSD